MELVKKLSWTLLAVVLLAVLLPMADVQARQSLTEDNFDYEWYLEKHPELAALVSAEDRDIIWTFYETSGEPGGWLGRRTKESYEDEWDLVYEAILLTLDLCVELGSDYGIDYDLVYDWYTTTGAEKIYAIYERYCALMDIYDIADNITDDTMSDWEKIKAVHDWLCVNVDFDYDNYLNDTIPDRSYYVEGVVYYGKAVCNGYMLAFEAFMDVLGIENENVIGWSETEGHGWNKVKLDGNWYEIDVTWDDLGLYGQDYCYDYFLISEEQMNIDHGEYVRD